MANEKTILLSGTEQEVKISGQNCGIRNDGVDTVYISRNPNIVPDSDGVLSVPAGQAAKYYDLNGFVYLLGTGKVQLNCNDYSTQDFRVAATSSGEGGADIEALKTAVSGLTETVAQNAEQLTGHADDADIHLTAGKAIEAAATAISNPNLADNPDFSTNQRGLTEYTGGTESTPVKVRTLDRWFSWLMAGKTVTVNNGYVTLRGNAERTPSIMDMRQWYPDARALKGEKITLSVCYRTSEDIDNCIFVRKIDANGVGAEIAKSGFGTSDSWSVVSLTAIVPEDINTLEYGVWGTDIDVKWIKLELGSVATPFTPPDPTVEMAKCQRYLLDVFVNSAYRAVAINNSYIDFSIPTPTTMRPISGMTIINPQNLAVRAINSGTAEEGFSFAVSNYGRNQLRLRATKAAHGLTDATLVILGDSVLLSAEL